MTDFFLPSHPILFVSTRALACSLAVRHARHAASFGAESRGRRGHKRAVSGVFLCKDENG